MLGNFLQTASPSVKNGIRTLSAAGEITEDLGLRAFQLSFTCLRHITESTPALDALELANVYVGCWGLWFSWHIENPLIPNVLRRLNVIIPSGEVVFELDHVLSCLPGLKELEVAFLSGEWMDWDTSFIVKGKYRGMCGSQLAKLVAR